MRLNIILLTDKAKKINEKEKKLDKKQKLANKLMGQVHEVIKEEPYTIQLYFKKAPNIFISLLPQIELGLKNAYEEEGLEEGIDFKIKRVEE